MTRDEALDKIRKLLNGKGRTEAEADTAQMLAAALAAKHDIDIAEVDRADEARRACIAHKVVGEWTKIPEEARYAAFICARFFEVDQFSRTGWTEEKIFVGTEHYIQIADYVFKFLIGEFRRAWNRRPNKRIKKRSAFIHGCYLALFSKLWERFEETKPAQMELSLEVSWKAKREAYITENFGELTVTDLKKKSVSAATKHGIRAGHEIEIRPGVDGGNVKRPDQLTTGGTKLLTG